MKKKLSTFAVFLLCFDIVAGLECPGVSDVTDLPQGCTVISGHLTVDFGKPQDFDTIVKKLETITKITGGLEISQFPNEDFNHLPNLKEVLSNVGKTAIRFERSKKLKSISFNSLETLKGDITFKNDQYPINVRKNRKLLQSIVNLEEKTHPDQCIAVKVDMSNKNLNNEYNQHELLINVPSYVKAWERRDMLRFIGLVFFGNCLAVVVITNVFLSFHLRRLKGRKFVYWKSNNDGNEFLSPPAPVEKAPVTKKKTSVAEKKSVSTEKNSISTEKNSVSTEKKSVSTGKKSVSTQKKSSNTQKK